MVYILLTILAVFALFAGCTTFRSVGRSPRGELLERVRKSPQWDGKRFQNANPTPTMTSEQGTFKSMGHFMFGADKNKKPKADVPTLKIDLNSIDRADDIVVWLGHSSLFVQVSGKRFLFDPVLTSKFPAGMALRPFRGSAVYSPDDIPDVDYLIITHNHWDHLDYPTVKAIKDKVGAVYCSLGIGQTFEYWKYPKEKIHDMDWQEAVVLDNGIKLYCLPARHFSGRLTGAGKTLWASYLIETPVRKIFVSGDGGYDTHFKEIGLQFPDIDLAVMENGQYNEDWKYVHTLPSLLPRAIEDLGAKRVMTYHNSKFKLALHAWNEPMELIYQNSLDKPWNLLTPRIGETVTLDRDQEFQLWWRTGAQINN